jgi:stringent starvation protein B
MSHPLPPKKEVALALLERSSVHVHLDPRGAGVVVPPWFKRQPQLVLQVGLNMPVPIPDLRLDEEGLSCTLSFNRSPFYCVVPWTSVFAMVGDDGRGMVWPDEVPPEIAKQPRGNEGAAPARSPVRAAPVPEDPEPKRPSSRRGADAAPNAPRAVPVEEARQDKPAAKGRRGKKKRPEAGEEAARPQLVAVPPADSSPSVSGPVRPVPSPAPRPVPSPKRAPSSKQKRELPPYLRIVK